MKKNWSLLVGVAVLISLTTACGNGTSSTGAATEKAADTETGAKTESSDEKAYTLKVGGLQSTEDPSTEALYRMADLASELSGGSLTLEIYPASQLGAATNQIEAISMGSQDMFVDAGWMGTFLEDKVIDGMWFTFEDAKHYENYTNSDLNKKLEEDFLNLKNIRIVASNWFRAPRSFASKTEIASVNDFNGMKIRVPDLTGSLESVAALGGNSSQVAWSETYLALSQGVVDAAEGPLDNLYSMNFYEAAPYITITNHNRDSMQVMINENVFQKLSENQQKALTDAALQAGEWYSDQIDQACEDALAIMEENGAVITYLDEDALSEMAERVRNRTKELDEAGTYWTSGMYEQIAAMAE